jgi:hypothetical protein
MSARHAHAQFWSPAQATVQYRQGLFLNRYPLIEIYIINPTSEAITFKRGFLNGTEVKPLTNGVVWAQWYPSEKVEPGQTILYQVCLEEHPKAGQYLELETDGEQFVKAELPPFRPPSSRITAVTFPLDYRRAFVFFECSPASSDAVSGVGAVIVNGQNLMAAAKVVTLPTGKEPGLVALELPSPLKLGQPVHVELRFLNGSNAQCLLRASSGITINAFGVPKANAASVRNSLALDERPSFQPTSSDVACNDTHAHLMGKCAQQVADHRRKQFLKGEEALRFVYLCTATANAIFGIYGQATDAVAVNPYRLAYSWGPGTERFIEAEEEYFGWAWMASQPRPIGWLPETFTFPWKNRMIEPGELRLLSYAALGSGVKIIWYYTFESRAAGKGVSEIHGFEKSGPLLAEVGKINRDVKKMEGIFSAAVPISSETVGGTERGLRQQTLWAGDEGMIVVVRNLDYQTDREVNDLCAKPRCKVMAKEKARVTVKKPEWLGIKAVRDGLTGQPVKWEMNAEGIELDLGRLDLGRVIFIQIE